MLFRSIWFIPLDEDEEPTIGAPIRSLSRLPIPGPIGPICICARGSTNDDMPCGVSGLLCECERECCCCGAPGVDQPDSDLAGPPTSLGIEPCRGPPPPVASEDVLGGRMYVGGGKWLKCWRVPIRWSLAVAYIDGGGRFDRHCCGDDGGPVLGLSCGTFGWVLGALEDDVCWGCCGGCGGRRRSSDGESWRRAATFMVLGREKEAEPRKEARHVTAGVMQTLAKGMGTKRRGPNSS